MMEATKTTEEEVPEEVDLFKVYPDMKPIKVKPAMFTINGFGLSLVGRRKEDLQYGTYIKTHVLTALFIPILGLGAYRVADAPEGWYFIGKVKASKFVAIWNFLVITLLTSLIGGGLYTARTNSPDYKAEKFLEKGAQYTSENKPLLSAQQYLLAYELDSPTNAQSALDGFKASVDAGIASEDHEETVGATKILLDSSAWGKLRPQYDTLYQDSLARIKAMQDEAPDSALKLSTVVRKIAGEDTELQELRTALLERVVTTQSELDQELARELTVIYRERNEHDKTIALLSPHQDKLKGGMLAYDLGQAQLNMGDHQSAVKWLSDFLDKRSELWTAANNTVETRWQKSYDEAIDALNNNKAATSFYLKYDSASTEEQNILLNEYLINHMNNDSLYQLALKKAEKLADVPVAKMDLGIAYLRLAQEDPSLRQENLERAEETLLSLSSYAGESQEYKLFLGQVYYWLGKPTEGKELFDSLVESSGRSYGVLSHLAHVLREIGMVDEAVEYAEEAYEIGKEGEEKDAIASTRSVLAETIEEKIEWLEKIQTKNGDTEVALNTAKAQLAWQKNDKASAKKYYQKALAGYASLSESSANINNMALVHFELYAVTGEKSHYEDGLQKMDRALQLLPNHSILCGNVSDAYFKAANQDLLDEKLGARFMQYGVDASYFRYFYQDEASREAVTRELRAHPSYKKACSLYEKTLLLAPQSVLNYSNGISIFSITRDEPMMQLIADKIKESGVDISGDEAEWVSKLDEGITEEDLESVKIYRTYQEEALQEMDIPLSKAIISSFILTCDLGLWGTTPIEDIDDRIAQHNKLYESFPSSAMRGSLTSLLQVKACQDLLAGESKFAQWLKSSKRQVTYDVLLLLWMESTEDKPAMLEKYPSIKEALLSMAAEYEPFPSTPAVKDWIVARALSDQGAAEEIKERLFKDPIREIMSEATKSSGAYAPASVIQRTWRLMALGEDEKAKALYQGSQQQHRLLPKLY